MFIQDDNLFGSFNKFSNTISQRFSNFLSDQLNLGKFS